MAQIGIEISQNAKLPVRKRARRSLVAAKRAAQITTINKRKLADLDGTVIKPVDVKRAKVEASPPGSTCKAGLASDDDADYEPIPDSPAASEEKKIFEFIDECYEATASSSYFESRTRGFSQPVSTGDIRRYRWLQDARTFGDSPFGSVLFGTPPFSSPLQCPKASTSSAAPGEGLPSSRVLAAGSEGRPAPSALKIVCVQYAIYALLFTIFLSFVAYILYWTGLWRLIVWFCRLVFWVVKGCTWLAKRFTDDELVEPEVRWVTDDDLHLGLLNVTIPKEHLQALQDMNGSALMEIAGEFRIRHVEVAADHLVAKIFSAETAEVLRSIFRDFGRSVSGLVFDMDRYIVSGDFDYDVTHLSSSVYDQLYNFTAPLAASYNLTLPFTRTPRSLTSPTEDGSVPARSKRGSMYESGFVDYMVDQDKLPSSTDDEVIEFVPARSRRGAMYDSGFIDYMVDQDKLPSFVDNLDDFASDSTSAFVPARSRRGSMYDSGFIDYMVDQDKLPAYTDDHYNDDTSVDLLRNQRDISLSATELQALVIPRMVQLLARLPKITGGAAAPGQLLEAQQKAQVEGASAAYTSPAVTHALTALDEQIVTSAPASSAASRFNPFKKKKLNPTPLASIAAKTAVAQDATSSLVTAPAPAPPLAGEFPPPPAAVPSRVQRFK
ncbi:Oidioi.mRNA.OKI2018_I69.chr1.g50.t1.cds [Oikopleura dioica]|uniref:Oidioi.mRNA.OKI2018_I69.chr1.g50.t1.cds n=1 Tax=Oikopleura dioica TaxID=34765 RepID=A0ABN7SQV7_OIKDI|nr:Oidioi.mRNA.OKI2018_I69.chr1.g50.t1.cds [Oikopleura dioica]